MKRNLAQITMRIMALVVVSGSLLLMPGCGGSSNSEPIQQPPPPPPHFSLVRLSSDPYANSTSQHATEVEPDTFAFGSTIVSTFQVGRRSNGGGSDVGFATSSDSGVTWSSGFLPGITLFQDSGTADAASDPVVAYDAAHHSWIIATLPIPGITSNVAVSRSPDGINWDNPIRVNVSPDADKNWIVCDNGTSSPFFGHCYVEWENIGSGLIYMSTSTDGGLSWGPEVNTENSTLGIGGQPVVQPSGTVIMPIASWDGASMLSFTSSDGGASWKGPVTISTIADHTVAGGFRGGYQPTAEIDSAGKVYLVWQDCRFRTNCTANDLVLSTSTDGISWTAPSRIPIDPLTSTVDHFIPGLAVDPATSGSSAHLTLTYYSYSQTNCTFTDCAMSIEFVSSADGGTTWSAPQTLAGPMSLAWLPSTGLGRMVGDYISTSYVNGKAFAVFAVARANSGSVFDEAMYTTRQPLVVPAGAARFSSAGERPVPNARSDHGPRKHEDERPEPPPKRLSARSTPGRTSLKKPRRPADSSTR
jgi:hypothetical protein